MPAAARLYGLVDERRVAIELPRLEPAAKGPSQEATEHLAGLLLLGRRLGTGQQPFLGRGPRVERPGEFQATDEHGGRSRVRGRLVEGDQHPLAASQRREADRDRIRRLARRARDDERFEDPRRPCHGAGEPVEVFLCGGLRQFLAAEENRHPHRLWRIGVGIDFRAKFILPIGRPFKGAVDRAEFDRFLAVGRQPTESVHDQPTHAWTGLDWRAP